jgi:hypothetical protein
MSPSSSLSSSLFAACGEVLLGLLLLAGCSLEGASSTTVRPRPIQAELRDGERVVVENLGPDTVWTAQFGARILARISWRPTVSPPGLAPGDTAQVPLQKIPMEENEERLLVYWWEAVQNDGTRQPSTVLNTDLEL